MINQLNYIGSKSKPKDLLVSLSLAGFVMLFLFISFVWENGSVLNRTINSIDMLEVFVTFSFIYNFITYISILTKNGTYLTITDKETKIKTRKHHYTSMVLYRLVRDLSFLLVYNLYVKGTFTESSTFLNDLTTSLIVVFILSVLWFIPTPYKKIEVLPLEEEK